MFFFFLMGLRALSHDKFKKKAIKSFFKSLKDDGNELPFGQTIQISNSEAPTKLQTINESYGIIAHKNDKYDDYDDDDDDDDDDDENELTAGQIIGIVVGCLAFVVIVIIIICFCCCYACCAACCSCCCGKKGKKVDQENENNNQPNVVVQIQQPQQPIYGQPTGYPNVQPVPVYQQPPPVSYQQVIYGKPMPPPLQQMPQVLQNTETSDQNPYSGL